MMKSRENIILLLLFLLIVMNIFFLKDDYYKLFNKESFDSYGNNYSHTVDLPINTNYSCKNMCGSNAKCILTGEQCTSDIDCYGCKPKSKSKKKNQPSKSVKSYNDNGKLTDAFTPNFSVLTNDIGTKTYFFEDKINSPAFYYNKGINTWRDTFNIEQQLYDKRYKYNDSSKIHNLSKIRNYKAIPTLSGEFLVIEPQASNATL